jgi:molybdate transport system substrate-binding protein
MVKRLVCSFIFITLYFASPAFAGTLVLASGAGYKKLVNNLVATYAKESGIKFDLIFGNMARITAQTKISGKVDLVLGSDWFLSRSGIDFAEMYPLGRGRLVVAWAKNTEFHSYRDMLSPTVKRIAIPDINRTIYGKAAMEYLVNTKIYETIKKKTIEVATIPQVSSYLIANEVDMGFINLTHAQQIKDKLAGYALVEEDKYDPIAIVLGVVSQTSSPESVSRFLKFLDTNQAKAIISAHGL